ncbi:MAG: YdeI/OmpD-associated family protein [Dokdonella sp.]|uniref:YdeI/OmpD-associated family protein n=1 Tax=Dokdonella sp. TaxID=2291710 RepID=UPI0032644BE9
MSKTEELQHIRSFKTIAAWAEWLAENHGASSGLWLRLAMKSSGIPSVTYAEAVDVALCHGWIDGQKKPDNEQYWLQKFTPRKSKSIWSKINREKALSLIERGEMKAGGLQEVDRAKSDGRWDDAYDSARTATVPDDLQAALDASGKAKAVFATLSAQDRYSVLFRVQTAKRAETRARRIQVFVQMLEDREAGRC